MVDVVFVLLGVSLVLFFGFFTEFLFKKLSIPDVLFLILLGFVLGPNVLGYVSLDSIQLIVPVFTAFTLLFLIFDGAFNIHLASLVKEFSKSLSLTVYNFLISSILITLVMLGLSYWVEGISILEALLTGFILGGVSSSFVIPVLKDLKVSEKLYSLLTLESALTDVFCIVFSLTVLEIIKFGTFEINTIFTGLVSLFAIASFVGIFTGVIWIFLSIKVFKDENYMMTIAVLLLSYTITELMGGNGAIAALFFGLMLKNSKQLTSILKGVTTEKKGEKRKAISGDLGKTVVKRPEEFFYHQISFLLKTFFFVYIGLLIDISNTMALVVGGIISVLLMASRSLSLFLTKKMESHNRSLVNSVFARGLAAAAIVQVALVSNLPHIELIAKITYVVITGTIVLSSIRVFITKRLLPKLETANGKKK